MADLRLPDTSLFYNEVGQGIPCLVMHGGLGLDHTYLHPGLDPLGDTLRLVYYDHRGHGRSGRPPMQTVTFEQLADDADRLRAHLGFERIAVLGHSFGGFIALEYALRYPHRTSHLLLLNTGPAWISRDEMVQQARRKGAESTVMPVFDRRMDLDSDEAVLNAFSAVLPLYFYRFDPAMAERLTARMIVHGALTSHGFRLLHDRTWLPHLSSITVPTLILAGRADLFFTVQQAEQLNTGLSRSTLIVFEESGHFPYVEEPDRFVAAVRRWIRQNRDL